MSGATVSEFIAYWVAEGQNYARRGDYEWMAALLPGRRVLEIGCGPGFGTQALIDRGLSVLVIDNLEECLALTQSRIGQGDLRVMQAEVSDLNDTQRADIAGFAPDAVVCWLMGAPASVTGASASDGGQAVVAYREKIHRVIAELAASLPTVNLLHYVDRTVIPWQAKDIGRDTLLNYHLGKTLRDLPFTALRANALYRKIEGGATEMAAIRRSYPAVKGVVPSLASLLAERKK